MSENQLKLIVWCAAGFLGANVLLWLLYALFLWCVGRL